MYIIKKKMDEIFGTRRAMRETTTKKSAIYVWGYNESGQTGRKGKQWQLRIPRQLRPQLFGCPAATGPNSRWFDIACGREHTAAVASDGSLFTWGIIYFFIALHYCIPFCVCSLAYHDDYNVMALFIGYNVIITLPIEIDPFQAV